MIKLNKFTIEKCYSDVYNSRMKIYKENNNISCIYCWVNLIDNKLYIGSTANLNARLYCYMSQSYLKTEIVKSKSLIYRALLDYGYNNFSLVILKYCNSYELIKWEQYYINKVDPEYNLLKIAGSSLGFKHSPETLLKMKTINKHNKNRENVGLAIKLARGHVTLIINKKDKSIIKYNSLRDAAKALNIDHSLIRSYIKSGKLYKNTYLIIRFIKLTL